LHIEKYANEAKTSLKHSGCFGFLFRMCDDGLRRTVK